MRHPSYLIIVEIPVGDWYLKIATFSIGHGGIALYKAAGKGERHELATWLSLVKSMPQSPMISLRAAHQWVTFVEATEEDAHEWTVRVTRKP